MNALPDDLLIQIFSIFCFHCHHPSQFPHSDSHDVRTNKQTLAYLSRTSRDLQKIAQPILYHYFATGNLQKETKIYQGHDGVERQFPEPDFLPQFLRTMIQRPDLASRIVAMQMVHDNTLAGYAGLTQTIQSLIKYSTSNNLLTEPSLPDDWLDGRFSEWRFEGQRSSLRRWLITLALVLSPRLRSLLLAIDHDAEFTYTLGESPHPKLLSLRTLGLMRHQYDYHFTELEYLYAAAPNLETIYACDAAGWSANAPDSNHGSFENGFEYDLQLPNLRKLALSGLIPSNLGSLLPCLPNLEDLEYYWDRYELVSFDLLDMLQPVEETLRRLCISFLPEWVEGLPDLDGKIPPDVPSPHWYQPPEIDYEPIKTLAEFKRLSDLTIDCRSIYRETDRDSPDRLTNLLPVTIRRLRISYLYRGMFLSLSSLGSDASQRFPNLEQVTIGVVQRADPKYQHEIDNIGALREVFEARGIEFKVEKDQFGPDPTMMIPGAVVRSQLISLPGYRPK
ncbi:hypothetical protein P154DRAFT_625525 [Amniculicola lignicola CBS 123094]|uniref:F-box domain-containing protein n=1 Tax=Amniculicola lignicola CBS 123094 TaxID=1392246 RepID=A0A6A5VXA1_9PLEO|nr:hypothetical protein P154DRAFT_625525 [Amniculicola lignicola CBS 123094]